MKVSLSVHFNGCLLSSFQGKHVICNDQQPVAHRQDSAITNTALSKAPIKPVLSAFFAFPSPRTLIYGLPDGFRFFAEVRSGQLNFTPGPAASCRGNFCVAPTHTPRFHLADDHFQISGLNPRNHIRIHLYVWVIS